MLAELEARRAAREQRMTLLIESRSNGSSLSHAWSAQGPAVAGASGLGMGKNAYVESMAQLNRVKKLRVSVPVRSEAISLIS